MESSVLDLVRTVWERRRWMAIFIFVLPLAAATTFIASVPSIYESTATILVERQQVPETLVRPTVTSLLETRLQTISQDILSRSRLEALITRFSLYPELRTTHPVEALVERMRGDIRLDIKGADPRGRAGTMVAFAISYRGRDPKTVAQVTNTLASSYIEENLRVRERQASGTAQFLKAQLEETRIKLDNQERVVSAFKKRYVGELPQQMQANLASVEQLNAQLRLNSMNLMRLEEKRDLLSMQLPADVPAVGSSAVRPPDPLALNLATLRQQLQELSVKFTDAHPSVIAKKAQIAALEERMSHERPAAESAAPAQGDKRPAVAGPPLSPQVARVSRAISEGEAEIKILKDEDKRLRQTLALYEQRVSNTPRREQEFQEMSRDYDAAKELYQSLVKRLDEAQLGESMEQRQKGEQFRFLDAALASAVPAAPKRPRLFAIAVALSLGLAVGAVVLAEMLDTSFHTIDALRGFTKVPVIAGIPRIVTDADAAHQRRRFHLAAAGTTVLTLLVVGVSYFFAHGNEALVRW
jgi:protein tyrosine kinase modulator